MQTRLSKEVIKKLEKIHKQDKKLSTKIEKQLTIFAQNPKHPSLRLHKLSGELQNLWSISITKEVRMVYIKSDNEAYFTDIGTHEEVYRK
jgi:addiction module RelE/StbE family toxin